MKSGYTLFYFFIVLLAATSSFFSMQLHAQTLHYPRIQKLSKDDSTFLQATYEIERYYRAVYQDESPPPLTIFSYSSGSEENLFQIAARFNLPYESIALLNGIRGPESLSEGDEVLIPSQPGIFISEEPRNDLERLLLSWRAGELESARRLKIYSNDRLRTVHFLQGERFHPIERSFFLNVLFNFPLPSGVVTSGYGKRVSPFSHKVHFHHGIDIAAPEGTEVYATSSGTVTAVRTDDILGKYIILLHRGNFSTIYGHLQKIYVREGSEVQTGSVIGAVGNTGLSTGPHLHFEIRNAGESWNPSDLIP